MIRYLKHKQIDKKKWDARIDASSNRIIYAYSWYLDIVSPNWDALVLDDYLYVMPLPVKHRFGLKYLVRPHLCQQLGIFSQEPLTQEVYKQFFEALNFPYVFICFDSVIGDFKHPISVTPSPNFVLSLHAPYEDLQQSFTENTRRNIKKAQKNGIEIKTVSPENYLLFVEKYMKGGYHSIAGVLRKLLSACLAKNACELLGAYSNTGELLAVNFFLVGSNRYINVMPASNPEGIEKSAMFLLLSSFIESHAASTSILDFEGSSIDGIARFYKGFGAENEPYFFIRKNSFPRLFGIIQYLKKN